MKGRLFWKILFAFWITFFCVVPAIWLPLADQTDGRIPPEQRISAMSAGRTASVRDQGENLTSDASFLASSSWQVLLVGGVAGFGFSVLLARYLVRPVEQLQAGFDQLKRGDFAIRLSPRMGRRHDEIADLAQDFDGMAQRLDALVNARDRLLHDVSHELRSPLSRLQLAIGLLRQDTGRREELLDRVEAEVQRLSSMVGEILSLARLESRAADEELYFDPIDVLHGVLFNARFEADQMGVKIAEVMDLEGVHGLICQGQGELFSRAIDNIVRNAIRFSPRGSAITVRVSALGNPVQELHLAVEDNGPGVPAAMLDDMFDDFATVQQAGFGLGLSIARRAIVSQGGSIIAENRPDGGLGVEVRVPVMAAAA